MFHIIFCRYSSETNEECSQKLLSETLQRLVRNELKNVHGHLSEVFANDHQKRIEECLQMIIVKYLQMVAENNVKTPSKII